MKSQPILALADAGQSVWLDSLRRSLIRNGELKRLIEEDGLRGMTSNPTIFEKAIAGGAEYDPQIRELLAQRDWQAKDLYEELAIRDIQDAADLFRIVYDRTHGLDGYVSLEVSPYLARDTEGTILEARRLWSAVSRQNVMIKVPATEEGIPAIRTLVGEGINVNITLLFSQERYEEVAEAYISGLEKYIADEDRGDTPPQREISRIASVASFFVSRVDTLADALLEDRARSTRDESLRELQGKIAVANAKLAYQRYQRIFTNNARWHALSKRGARPQRVLWASTGVKNPKYRDTFYVEELVGPETVTTLPPATFSAFQDHGKVSPLLTENLEDAARSLARLEKSGISLHGITELLTKQAIELFSDPFDRLLGALEKKRRQLLEDKIDSFAYELPSELSPLLSEHLKDWADHGKVRRFWTKDSSLWTRKGEEKWLGWLHALQKTPQILPAFSSLKAELVREGVTDVVVLGMGGSSLAPEVFAEIFSSELSPRLSVIDTTHPDQIKATESRIDLNHAIFIVSSKSGSTLEPSLLFDYFSAKYPENPGKHFIAITDPGSALERLAHEKGFRAVFPGDPEIGGRYSALSPFGMVPAALCGIDVRHFLERAHLMSNSCGEFTPPKENPGVHLGLLLGVLAHHGRNKVTFVSSKEVAPLELWLEQLLAESTGKDGKGIIPISGEPLSSVESYGPDRVFIHLKYASPAHEDELAQERTEERLIELQESGQPVVRILIRDLLNLGQEFLRWEIATAVAGSILEINPFDQPDVEAAKVETRKILATPPEPARSQVQDFRTPYREFFESLREGDYVALLSYLPMQDDVIQELERVRIAIRNHMRVATTLQFGPRYLHSTGQAFKGGPKDGLFMVLTRRPDLDLKIPGQEYGFREVVLAQAMGDLEVLRQRGQRAIHVDVQDLAQFHSEIKRALQEVLPLNNQVNTQGLNKEFKMNRERKIGGSI